LCFTSESDRKIGHSASLGMKLFGAADAELIRDAGHYTNTKLWELQITNAFSVERIFLFKKKS
jgi:hypothetical protein